MTNQADDLTYHRRRAEQERSLAEAASEPWIKRVHEQLAQFHLERLEGPGGLKIVQPG